MIRYLLILQFPFWFLTSLFVGLGVYWVGEELTPIYLASLLALFALHLVFRRLPAHRPSIHWEALILLAGLALSAWVYRPLHLGFWDESSASQALGLTALGIASLAASHLGARLKAGDEHSLGAALMLVGAAWMPATQYPLLPFLFVGLAQALALAILSFGRNESRPPPRRPAPGAFLNAARCTVLAAGVSLAGTVWDYQEDTRWAVHLTLALLAAGPAAILAGRYPRRALTGGIILLSATYLATWLAPQFLLYPLHGLGAGLALGAALACLDLSRGAAGVLGSSLLWTLGVLVSVPFARFVAWAPWQAALMVPLWIYLRLAWAGSRAQATRRETG